MRPRRAAARILLTVCVVLPPAPAPVAPGPLDSLHTLVVRNNGSLAAIVSVADTSRVSLEHGLRGLRVAQRMNPRARVIAVRPSRMRDAVVRAGLGFFPLTHSKEYDRLYQHSSVNPRRFELFCFERYRLVLSALRAARADAGAVAVVDDDLVVMHDLADLVLRAPPGVRSAHVALPVLGALTIASAEALRRFVAFTIAAWSLPSEQLLALVRAHGVRTASCPSTERCAVPRALRWGEPLLQFQQFSDMWMWMAFQAAGATGGGARARLPFADRLVSETGGAVKVSSAPYDWATRNRVCVPVPQWCSRYSCSQPSAASSSGLPAGLAAHADGRLEDERERLPLCWAHMHGRAKTPRSGALDAVLRAACATGGPPVGFRPSCSAHGHGSAG